MEGGGTGEKTLKGDGRGKMRIPVHLREEDEIEIGIGFCVDLGKEKNVYGYQKITAVVKVS